MVSSTTTSRSSNNYNQKLLWTGGGMVVMICILLAVFFSQSNSSPKSISIKTEQTAAIPLVTFQTLSDLKKEDYYKTDDLIQKTVAIEHYIDQLDVPPTQKEQAIILAKQEGITQLKKGHKISRYHSQNSDYEQLFLLYEVSEEKDALIMLLPEPYTDIRTTSIVTKIKAEGGIVKTTLWDAMEEKGIRSKVTEKMEEALQWLVDFYHVEQGDKFKVIYEERQDLMGNVIDIGQLHAVYFKTRNKEFNLFYYEEGNTSGYFDAFGKTAQRVFLKSPVKYGRISSSYNPARIHPVTGELKAHKGTDFAAPEGAPIYATADGVVEKATFSKNNGNFVRIVHLDPYKTQYLHMQRFAEGIQPGTRVRQGQVIGYVGKTGLATGPHVCYRFWKGKEQVDPFLEDIVVQGTTAANADIYADRFFRFADSLQSKLNLIEYNEFEDF